MCLRFFHHPTKTPRRGAGAVFGILPWRKNYFFLALAFTAALGADLVVFFETGFFATAMMDLLSLR